MFECRERRDAQERPSSAPPRLCVEFLVFKDLKMSVIKLTDLDLKGKRVLIREDLNVPVKDGKATSDKRIRASLPSIEFAMKAGAKVMLMSHLGRPTEGEVSEEN